MRRLGLLSLGMLLGVAMRLSAAELYTETFSTNLGGWEDRDLAKMTVTNDAAGNSGSCLRGTFAAQGTAFPEIDAFVATGALSSASFTGDYDSAGALLIGFDFQPMLVAPSDLQLRLVGEGMTLFRTLTNELAPARVYAVAAQSPTNVYAGGVFTTAGASPARNVARWNGSAWTNLGSGLQGAVYAMAATAMTNVYAAGNLTNAGGIAVGRIAQWNGASWTNLGAGMDGTVWALAATAATNLYAAGDFTNAGGVACSRIAQWNGTSWTNLGAGMDGTVWALAATAATNLYAAGDFTNAGSVAANRIARWNGNAWTNLGSGMETTVWALALTAATNLFAGGDFTNAGGVAANHVAKWKGAAWTNLSSGISGRVRALAVTAATNAYAGGDFTSPGNRIVRWNNSTWSTMSSAMDAPVWALSALAATNLFVGGDLSAAGSLSAYHVARWSGAAWTNLASGIGRWFSIAVSLRSSSLGGWNGNTGSFGNILTNVSAVTLQITRNNTPAQSYLVDNFFIDRLPEATDLTVSEEGVATMVWQNLRTNAVYRWQSEDNVTNSTWSMLDAFSATDAVRTVVDPTAGAADFRHYRLVVE